MAVEVMPYQGSTLFLPILGLVLRQAGSLALGRCTRGATNSPVGAGSSEVSVKPVENLPLLALEFTQAGFAESLEFVVFHGWWLCSVTPVTS